MNFKFSHNPREYGMSYTVTENEATQIPKLATPQADEAIRECHGDSNGGKTVLMDIGSASGLCNWLEACEGDETYNRSSHEKGTGFSGVDSFEDALEVARFGDAELVKRIKERSAEQVDQLSSAVEKPWGVQRDVYGNYFDVGLYLSGEPEAFYRERKEMVQDKVINLDISTAYSGSVQVEKVISQLVSILTSVRLLEISGYSVGVTLYWLSQVSNKNFNNVQFRFQVKPAREPLNLNRLVGVVHPSFFRRLIFRAKELFRSDPIGYGSPLSYPYKIEDIFEIPKEPDNPIEFLKKLRARLDGTMNVS